MLRVLEQHPVQEIAEIVDLVVLGGDLDQDRVRIEFLPFDHGLADRHLHGESGQRAELGEQGFGMNLAGALDLLRHQHRSDAAPNEPRAPDPAATSGSPRLRNRRCDALVGQQRPLRSRRGIAAECWRFLDCDAGRTFPAVYAKSLCDVYDWQRRHDSPPMNILLTGFGPFPGAPFNPTGRAGRKTGAQPSPRPRRRAAHVARLPHQL